MVLLTLKVILLLVVILTSLYSALMYSARKRESARQLAELRGRAQPLRRLSLDERQALTPFLFRPDRPGKPIRLHSEEVFPLSGPYRRHGISNQGNQTWHHMIGGVEVILPFDAEHFLDQDNQAEVVFADKLAVVVRLNGFELLEGAEREQRRETARDQWQRGESGHLQDVTLDDDDQDAARDPATGDRHRVEILHQRDETPAEIEARQGRGLGLLSGLCWSLALIAVALAASRQSGLWQGLWAALALAGAALGLWLFWRRRRPGPAGKVNRVTGYLNLMPVAVDEQQGTVSVAPVLGDKFPFSLPDHWRPHIKLEQDQRLDLGLRVDDYSVVDYSEANTPGRRFSVDEEQRRHPPVYWGRHLSLALVGLVALAAALLGPARPLLDAAQTGQWLAGAGPLPVDEPASLTATPPALGRRLIVNGEGRCQVAADPARVRCDRVRWGGDTLTPPDLEVDPLTRSLLSGDLLETRRERSLEVMAMMRGGGTGDRRPLVVSNARAVLASIDEACPNDDERACAELRRRALATLYFPAAPEEQDWATLRRRLAEEDDAQHREAVALQGRLDNLSDAMARVAEQRLRPLTAQLAEALAAQQKGGVVIGAVDGTDLIPLPPRDPAGRHWETLRALAGDGGRRAFKLDGVLVRHDQGADGAPLWLLDPERVDRGGPALARLLWVVAAVALLLVHGVLALRGYLAAGRRRRALEQEYGG
ncbi:IgaA/UmoB family intracellular growth attenuator [Alloalcanivorax sp. C16-1]|uniref:IgaA/UmoB family intracellular growth attenuator n=1 Tax=Alloalcanivorax sp. C16-1 TaxID=3390051 RepID=UPI003970A789